MTKLRVTFFIILAHLASLTMAQCSYQQVSKTSVPQGPNLVPPADLINDITDELQLDWASPLVYASDQGVFSRTMSVVISAPATPGQAMPAFGGIASTCKRQYTGPSSFSALPAPLTVQDCKVRMPYRQDWDSVMEACQPAVSTYVQGGNSWQLVQLEAWVRWRDYDSNGVVVFDTSMHWPLTFRMQLTVNQSVDSNVNITDPYVANSFTIISSSLEKSSSGVVTLMVSYKLKTRYPYKPKAHSPIMQFPLQWTHEAKIDAMANLNDANVLGGSGCDTGTPVAGDECIQSGEIAFSFDSALQCDPTGKFTFLFDVDCTTYMPGTVSDCSEWGLLSQRGSDLSTVFYIASGSNLCQMISTDGLAPQQVAPPTSVANNYGQNSRVSFKAKLAVPVPYVKLQLKDFNMTQDGTAYSWQMYSSFARLTFANHTDFEFSYDGAYNDTDLTSSFRLIYGDNKTAAITTAEDHGTLLSFTAAVTVRLFFDPYGHTSARRLMYRDTTIGGDELLLSTDSTSESGFQASVVESNPGQFDSVPTLVPNSFEITEFSYSREALNTTLFISYEVSTNYPYLLSEWDDVLVLPNGWSQDARDATWIRSQFAIQTQLWSDTPVSSSSTCLHSGVLRAVFPTDSLCDPAGTFGLTFNQSCFTGDSGDCLRYGEQLSASLTAFVLTSGVNLCAAASETYTTTITRPFGPQEAVVPVGGQAHLWTRFTTAKKLYAALVDSVLVEQVGTAHAWSLQVNGVPTAFANGVGFSAVSSYSGDKLTSTIDVRFTPNVGTTKTNGMIILSDRSGNVQFAVTMRTKFYFDAKASTDGISRRLLYEERTEERAVVRGPTRVLAREVKESARGPTFQGKVTFGTTQMQVSSTLATSGLSTGAIAGMAVAGTAAVLGAVGVGMYMRRRQRLADTLPHHRTSSESSRTSEESTRAVTPELNKGTFERARHRSGVQKW